MKKMWIIFGWLLLHGAALLLALDQLNSPSTLDALSGIMLILGLINLDVLLYRRLLKTKEKKEDA